MTREYSDVAPLGLRAVVLHLQSLHRQLTESEIQEAAKIFDAMFHQGSPSAYVSADTAYTAIRTTYRRRRKLHTASGALRSLERTLNAKLKRFWNRLRMEGRIRGCSRPPR